MQLLLFKPKFALLDELDSGLDVDAKRLVASVIATLQQEGMSFLVVSHDIEFIRGLNPTHLHIFKDRCLVSAEISTLNKIEAQGFCTL